MFIGHFALGLAAKRLRPSVSLAVFFGAAQLADLLWPLFLAAGLEAVRIDPGNTAFTPLDFVSYPYSHSLLILGVWAIAFGLAYRRLAGSSQAVLLLATLVISHWFLDALTHRPDMPLYPGGPKVGLGLWNSIPATVVIELFMFGAGVFLYARATRARDRTGHWSLFAYAIFLVAMYFLNLFGPPPPSIRALWMAAIIGGVVLTIGAWWMDRHRESVSLTAGRL